MNKSVLHQKRNTAMAAMTMMGKWGWGKIGEEGRSSQEFAGGKDDDEKNVVLRVRVRDVRWLLNAWLPIYAAVSRLEKATPWQREENTALASNLMQQKQMFGTGNINQPISLPSLTFLSVAQLHKPVSLLRIWLSYLTLYIVIPSI